MPLTPEQERAVRAPGSIAVTAGAGTGKTHLLTQRYLHHLTVDNWSPLQVVAVTFTERAAEELRARIRTAVAANPDAGDETLAELEAAQISTIHSLAARICRDHYDLAGIPPDFGVLDEQEGVIWRAEHFAAALDMIPLDIFRRIPFSLLAQALRLFLQDPHSAEAALKQGPEQWAVEIERARSAELQRLREHPDWREFGPELTRARGQEGDKLEVYRAAAQAAWKAIEANTHERIHFDSLCGIKVNVGAQKNWPTDTIPAIKEALKRLRDLVKSVREMATLEMGDLDARVAELLPLFDESFQLVQEHLDAAKRKTRKLDFNDLERYALRIMEQPAAQEFYRERWRAFLIDEFQDTNPIQGRLLRLLTEDARLTIVGDEQQSIYGFRRAEVEVFREFRERIETGGGKSDQLTKTYRAHQPLTERINAVFAAVLGAQHRGLSAERPAPHPEPHVTALLVEADSSVSKAASQTVEAAAIGREVRDWLDRNLLVYDKPTDKLRALRPGDVAVLSRTWEALDAYGDALNGAGIPTVHAGGGSLLDTREVQDAVALLTFLADEKDDLALVAAVRSPFFAISDRDLYHFATNLKKGQSWWALWQVRQPGAFGPAFDVLNTLRLARPHSSPRELMALADELTGYTAVIANLPSAARREADWRGFLELLTEWERTGINDVFVAVRQIRLLTDAEVSLPRPPLDSGDAVSLMTVHAAKGLEWPIVIVPDLARRPGGDRHRVRLDPQLGVALGFEDDGDERQKPAILKLIDARRAEREAAEARRVLYVALTRARDRVLLTASASKGNALDILLPGLAAAGIEVRTVAFNEEDARPPELEEPAPLPQPSLTLLGEIHRTVSEIRVTSLQDYAECPKRFHYRVILGYPDPGRDEPDGAGDNLTAEDNIYFTNGAIGNTPALASANVELPWFDSLDAKPISTVDPAVTQRAKRIGILTHRALELGLDTAEALSPYDPRLDADAVAEALTLATNFRTAGDFARFNGPGRASYRRECPVAIEFQDIRLIGTIDLAGSDFVLDYKTGRKVDPEDHRFQVWAYARAAGVQEAYLADLRLGKLHTFTSARLATIDGEAVALLSKVISGDFLATPSLKVCSRCSYSSICPESLASGRN